MTDNDLVFHAPIKGVILHAGKSHTDEIIAASIILGTFYGLEFPIFRRDPSPEELSDPDTWVVDVGGIHNPELSNFDHHGLSRDPDAVECSYTLVCKHLGIDDHMSKYYGWYKEWSVIDHLGPYFWAGSKGLPWDLVSGLLSPVAEILHDEFESFEGEVEMPKSLKERLRAFGIKLIREAMEFEQFCGEQTAEAVSEVKGIKVYKPQGTSEEIQAYALKWATDGCGAVGGVLVVPDDRGDGWTLLRINNDPVIDFSVLCGHYDVEFAHGGGFIAKTKVKGEYLHLIEAAIK
jgi:hypothetical protein